jgi:hypothetical protein
MTGVVCLPLNQGQVASAGSVTIRTALQCRSVPMISNSRRVVVRSKASRVLTQPEMGIPVAIINQGPTRGDAEATLALDAPLGPALTALAGRLPDR